VDKRPHVTLSPTAGKDSQAESFDSYIGLCSEGRTMWLISDFEAAAFVAIVALMVALALIVA
jgi:hypothetical protein